jgi:DNA-binding MarR family transcriptional regulator
MSQAQTVGPVEQSVGYVLKEVTTLLRSAMDSALRPLDLTVPQYVTLELLHQKPGLSNSELARRAFVTRQSMNLVLRTLQARHLVSRPDVATDGRARPADLTPAGQHLLENASVTVRKIELQLLSPLAAHDQAILLGYLKSCAAALTQGDQAAQARRSDEEA